MHARFDHLVVGAPSLAEGARYLAQALGVEVQPGGRHPRMGTHNGVVRLGERLYLEVIAVDPQAPAPPRPRWFGLDRPPTAPRLLTWVARSDDIRVAVAASPLALGAVEPMSRGALEWLITVAEDGSLPLSGVAPTLIEWPPGPHPADGLPDAGCTLVALEGGHAEATTLRATLDAIAFEGPFSVSTLADGEPPRLAVMLRTPAGLRTLRA